MNIYIATSFLLMWRICWEVMPTPKKHLDMGSCLPKFAAKLNDATGGQIFV